MSEFWYYDGKEVLGPHNLTELCELLREGVIQKETAIIPVGAKDWITVAQIPDLDAHLAAIPQKIVVQQAVSEGAVEKPQQLSLPVELPPVVVQEETDPEEESKDKPRGRHHHLRDIRRQLDDLWECQRESIIAAIKGEELADEYQKKRKENKAIYQSIENAAIDYWRRSGLLDEWIEALAWRWPAYPDRPADLSRKFRGETPADFYADIQEWLQGHGFSDVAGCYCFKKGREYVYIGKTQCLSQRIKDHEKKLYWIQANSMRIIIPKYSRHITKLERLLIMRYQPHECEKAGDSGNNTADDILEFVQKEIKELVTDF